jgi:hypothetical protein
VPAALRKKKNLKTALINSIGKILEIRLEKYIARRLRAGNERILRRMRLREGAALSAAARRSAAVGVGVLLLPTATRILHTVSQS